jgi:hypothetical protein
MVHYVLLVSSAYDKRSTEGGTTTSRTWTGGREMAVTIVALYWRHEDIAME